VAGVVRCLRQHNLSNVEVVELGVVVLMRGFNLNEVCVLSLLQLQFYPWLFVGAHLLDKVHEVGVHLSVAFGGSGVRNILLLALVQDRRVLRLPLLGLAEGLVDERQVLIVGSFG